MHGNRNLLCVSRECAGTANSMLAAANALNDAGNPLWLGECAGGASSLCPADRRGSQQTATSGGPMNKKLIAAMAAAAAIAFAPLLTAPVGSSGPSSVASCAYVDCLQ